jgi:hypothetical protein
MSLDFLIIPEDFAKDEHALKPIITAMMEALGRPKARVRVCRDPRLRGVAQATDRDQILEISERYKWGVDIFLLCVDRDGLDGRRVALNNIESFARSLLPGQRVFLAENAWQEIEVWVLAGHDLPGDWIWSEIRQHNDPKEAYYEPFARQRGLFGAIGEGRKRLAIEAARRYPRIRQLYAEDVQVLETRIAEWLANRA